MKPKKLLTFLLALVVFVTNITVMSIPVSATLLPIEEISARVEIKDFGLLELKEVPVQYLLDNMVYNTYYTDKDGVTHNYGEAITIAGDAAVAIAKGTSGDDYMVYSRTDTIDFSNVSGYEYYSLIVGSAKQLDRDNVKYLLECYVTDKYSTAHELRFYIPSAEEGGERTTLNTEIYSSYNGYSYEYDENDNQVKTGYSYYDVTGWDDIGESDEICFDIAPKLNIKVDGNDVEQENVKTEIVYDEGLEEGKLAGNSYTRMRINYYIDNVCVHTEIVYIYFSGKGIELSPHLYYKYNNNYRSISSRTSRQRLTDDDKISNTHFEIKPTINSYGYGYADDEYSLELDFYYGNYNHQITDVVKAVEGKYSTIEAAADATDIRDTLFNSSISDSLYDCFMEEKVYTIFYRFDEEGFLESVKNGENTVSPISEDMADIVPYSLENVTFFAEAGDETGAQPDSTDITDGGENVNTVENDEIDTLSEDNIGVNASSDDNTSDGTDDTSDVKAIRFSVKVTGKTRPTEPDTPTTSTVISNDPISISSLMSAYGAEGKNVFTTNRSLDSYYIYGYQTLFALDPANNQVDLTNIMLNVNVDERANVYDAVGSNKVDFENEPQNFSNGPIQYSVSAGDVTSNFFVNVAAQTEGAKLFVNGPSEREVFFDDYYGDYHDILVANIGTDTLTGLKAELTDAVNVKLDGYWNIGGEKNDTLAGFTTTYLNERANLAKVRLVPDGEGEVSGRLTITADGQEPVVIELKGHAGNPKIVSQSPIVEGVKYVPYFAIIATDNIHDWNTVEYFLDGDLPEGLGFNEMTGEIYGVPQESGEFTFDVWAEFSEFDSVSKSFELNILDNTNENVYMASDEGYDLITGIGTQGDQYNFTLSSSEVKSDQLFVSNGEYGQFADLWLNGVRLIPDEDYTSEAGSTRVTIRSQTLQKLTGGKSNTIAAEFRVNGGESKELKRTAQNFVIGKPSSSGGSSRPGGSGGSRPGSSGSGSGVSGTGTSVPAVTPSGASTWENIEKELSAKPDGGVFEITLRSSAIVPESVVKLAASKNIGLKVLADSSVTWLFDCSGITGELKPSVSQVLVSIPDDVLNNLSGLVKLPLRIDNADFGKNEKLIYNVGTTFAGQFVNLYAYSTSLEFMGSYSVAADGTAAMDINGSGKYVVAIDDHTHLAGDLDNSCTIDAKDCAKILRYIVGFEELAVISKADINYDSKVNAIDAALLLKAVAS